MVYKELQTILQNIYAFYYSHCRKCFMYNVFLMATFITFLRQCRTNAFCNIGGVENWFKHFTPSNFLIVIFGCKFVFANWSKSEHVFCIISGVGKAAKCFNYFSPGKLVSLWKLLKKYFSIGPWFFKPSIFPICQYEPRKREGISSVIITVENFSKVNSKCFK